MFKKKMTALILMPVVGCGVALSPVDAIANNSETLIVCQGTETQWHSALGELESKSNVSRTYSIVDNGLKNLDCKVASETKFVCTAAWVTRSMKQSNPGLLDMTFTVDLDRVSGFVREVMWQEKTVASEIQSNRHIRPFLGSAKSVETSITFEGYCKRAEKKF